MIDSIHQLIMVPLRHSVVPVLQQEHYMGVLLALPQLTSSSRAE